MGVKIKICDITNFEGNADRLPQLDKARRSQFVYAGFHVIALRCSSA